LEKNGDWASRPRSPGCGRRWKAEANSQMDRKATHGSTDEARLQLFSSVFSQLPFDLSLTLKEKTRDSNVHCAIIQCIMIHSTGSLSAVVVVVRAELGGCRWQVCVKTSDREWKWASRTGSTVLPIRRLSIFLMG